MPRKLRNKNIRKIMRNGNSRVVSIPVEYLNQLKWREKQKVIVKKRGKSIIITDWPAKS